MTAGLPARFITAIQQKEMEMKKIIRNVLSLFDGISCGRLALDRARVKYNTYFASEVDKSAIKVATKNFPDTVELGDVRNINTETLSGVDLLIGGSPCQNFTMAGKRQGLATEDEFCVTSLEDYQKLKKDGVKFSGQSYLFWEYVRILRELKPRYFLLENVKMEKKWQDVITKALGVEPVVINSNLLSAQNRHRLYWTNIPGIAQPEDKKIVLRDVLDKNVTGFDLSSKHLAGFLRSYPSWKPTDVNKKSPPLLASYYKQPPHCPYISCSTSESGYRRLTPTECERLQTLPEGYTEGVSNTQRYKSIGNGWTVDVIAHILKNLPSR